MDCFYSLQYVCFTCQLLTFERMLDLNAGEVVVVQYSSHCAIVKKFFQCLIKIRFLPDKMIQVKGQLLHFLNETEAVS